MIYLNDLFKRIYLKEFFYIYLIIYSNIITKWNMLKYLFTDRLSLFNFFNDILNFLT